MTPTHTAPAVIKENLITESATSTNNQKVRTMDKPIIDHSTLSEETKATILAQYSIARTRIKVRKIVNPDDVSLIANYTRVFGSEFFKQKEEQ